MASSCTVAETGPTLATMQAKMIVATGADHCQQLKDMVTKEDPSSMLVVMASSSTPRKNPGSPSPAMDPGLLQVARSGSSQALESFLNRRGSSRLDAGSGDEEALLGQDQEHLLDGVTTGGDTVLHVVAGAYAVGDDEVLGKARLIFSKAGNLLFVQNNNGDTPLHCAAREGANGKMVSLLIHLAKGEDNNANRVKALLHTENKNKWTVLHEAVRTGHFDLVGLLMEEDPQLASFPKDCISPMYLAILLENKFIAERLYEMSAGVLSYSGPNGKNALHAAVLRGKDLAEMVLGWNKSLTVEQDENGSTPLHFAASVPQIKKRRSLACFSFVDDKRRSVCLCLLKANPHALYVPDKDGSLPIHVAASSFGAARVVRDFLKQSPDCAGLRDARGRTFLHVAVDKRSIWTVISASTDPSLLWILNMQDNDGNTALHLAVQKGYFGTFFPLFSNRVVHLNLTNYTGKTPLDIARPNAEMESRLYYNQNSGAKIHMALSTAGAKMGICRHDYFKTDEIVQERQNEIRKVEILKESTQNLCIGSVLIATVTFGATFALPGGYRADDHTNGGTPTLAGRYGLDAFIQANAFAFVFSVMATVSLMFSGTPMVNTQSRTHHLLSACNLMMVSVKCLVAAFATGTYTMLAPVAHKTAIAVCAMSFLALVYADLEIAIKSAMVMPAIIRRRNRLRSILILPLSVIYFVGAILYLLWPIVFVFGLPALTYQKN